MSFWTEAIHQPIIFNALLMGIVASIACGIIGSYVVVKRLVFISGGIAHAILGGMGAAFYFDVNPKWGAYAAAVFFACIIAFVRKLAAHREDSIIGALWATGMAVGLLFIYSKPGYNSDLMSYLFGNILIVSRSDLIVTFIMTLAVGAVVYLNYKTFLAVCFDEEYAAVQGVAVQWIYTLLLCLIAVTVVMLIQIVGIILVIALLTLPAVIAGQYSRSIVQMMILASALGVLFTTSGIWIAYEPDLPAGAVIILTAAGAYIVSVCVTEWLSKRKKKCV